jgi:hypothetical protein
MYKDAAEAAAAAAAEEEAAVVTGAGRTTQRAIARDAQYDLVTPRIAPDCAPSRERRESEKGNIFLF